MAFNYFRILVTLLASFAAFFAYVCRYNLSLTINEMVIKDEPMQLLDQLDVAESKWAGTLRLPTTLISNEEHTLAWISRSRRTAKSKTALKNQKQGRIRASNFSLLSLDVNNTRSEKPVVNATETLKVNEQDEIQTISTKTLLNWNEKDRNDLLGAFFLGYVIFQIPSARAGEIFGAKSLFLLTGFGAGLCTLVFPFAATVSTSIVYAYAIRVIMGATQGALFPAVYVFLCEWLPPTERSKWLPVPSAFSRIGTMVMNLVVPIILTHYSWEAVYYAWGTATLAWCVIFIVFGSNSPNQSYWISKQELMYIESHMEPRVGTLAQQSQVKTASGFTINESACESLSQPSVNWIKIATNKALLILTLVMFSSEWSNMLLLVKLPGFLASVLKLDVAEIGFWSSILLAIYCVQYPLSGFCASKLETSKYEWLSSLRVRKIFELLAHLMQGVGCFVIAFSSDKAIVLSALFLMMLGRSTVGGGQCLMPPELSRDYPGTVFAFANTVANLAGIIGPMTVTWLVEDPEKHDSWFTLWIGSGILFFVIGAIFCLFADNRPQNYCRKSKASKSLSQAQITLSRNPEEIFKMDAFSRVSSEPHPQTTPDIGRES